MEVIGKTIRQIADESGRHGEEVVLNLLEANDLRVSIFNEVISEFNLDLIAKDRFSVVSSDGVGYDFPQKKPTICLTRGRSELFLAPSANWSKERNNDFGDDDFQNDYSSRPYLRDKDGGTIEKDKKADLVVFDEGAIEDIATYENHLCLLPESGMFFYKRSSGHKLWQDNGIIAR